MEKSTFFAADPMRATRLNSDEKPESDVRDSFQVDRDRILYSKAFRRLRGKTQVFIAGYDDHVRNRLSHTLEVSQIARTISKALGLNEMLTEAIALGHDLGHTPFGHVGERTLNDISTGKETLNVKNWNHSLCVPGFKHNWQSVRVACALEYHNRDYSGLNLTMETLWGFLHHSSLENKKIKPIFHRTIYGNLLPDEQYWSFEGLVVSLADEIAQRHHDIEDGLITNILDKDKLIDYLKDDIYNSLKGTNADNLRILLGKAKVERYPEFYLETLARAIVNFYVCEVVENTQRLFQEIVEEYSIDSSSSFYGQKVKIWNETIKSEKAFIKKMMSESLSKADDKLQTEYFKKRILHSYQAQKNDGKAAYVIKKIVEAYLTNPQQMPDNAIIMLFANSRGIDDWRKQNGVMKSIFGEGKDKAEIVGEMRVILGDLMDDEDKWSKSLLFQKDLLRTIIDYVAGMTDDYAIAVYEQLYGGTKKNRY